MVSSIDPDVRAARLAAEQDGLLTIADALRCGLTADQVRCRVASHRWERMVRGVYRINGAPETGRQAVRATQLATGHAVGVASHASAAALHGLVPYSEVPHITVPVGSSARCPIAVVHRSRVPGIDRATVAGIRATSVSRTIVDLANVLDRPALDGLVDDAICDGKATAESVLRSLDRSDGRRGRAVLRRALLVWSEAIKPGSQAEVRLLRRLAEWGVEAPVTQYEVRLEDGCFVARVDVAWPRRMAALEYEGVRPHSARTIDRDEARYERLRRAGWRVATVDKHDLLPGNRRLPDLLDRWLRADRAA